MSTVESVPQQGVDAVRKAVATRSRPKRASALTSALTFGWRGMLKIKHVPEQLLDVTVTPVMFVLLFTYVFGAPIAGSTEEYRDYLIPGILVQTVVFTTVYSGVQLNTDMTKGVIDRFRSLPMWRPAPLVGALMGDMVRYILAGTVIVLVGIALGFRPEGGVVGVVEAIALVGAFSFGVSWVFCSVGLLMRSQSAVMNAGFMAIFPVTFVSSVFIDPRELDIAWLRAVVEGNPISLLADACRGLMGSGAQASDVLIPLALSAALTLVFVPLTTWLYRKG